MTALMCRGLFAAECAFGLPLTATVSAFWVEGETLRRQFCMVLCYNVYSEPQKSWNMELG